LHRGRRPKASKETALGECGAVPRALIYRGLTLAAAVICQHNFCVMARTLLMVENSFCIMCNFKELRVAKGAVARLVGIEGGVVSGVINLESSGVEASDWRPRHDEPYHEV
jgi:hypothetical protein